MYSQTVGQLGQRAQSIILWEMSSALGLHHSNIMSRVSVPNLVFMGPVRGLLLDEGPHEVMHYY